MCVCIIASDRIFCFICLFVCFFISFLFHLVIETNMIYLHPMNFIFINEYADYGTSRMFVECLKHMK